MEEGLPKWWGDYDWSEDTEALCDSMDISGIIVIYISNYGCLI